MTESRSHAGDATALGSGSPGRRRYVVVFLIVLALYALGLNGFWRFERDSCLYMGLARSLAETGTYRFNGYPHSFVWPGLPALLAPIYVTLGENFLAMNLLITLFGLGCIAIWYALCSDLPVAEKQAFVCFLLFAFSRTLYYYSSHILADVPFTFAVLLGIWCGVHMLRAGPRQYAWCLAAAGAVCLATFLRPVGPCLLAALIAALWLRPGGLRRWRANLLQSVLLVVPIVVAGGLWALRCLRQTGRPGMTYVREFVTDVGFAHLVRHWVGSLGRVVSSLSDAVAGMGHGPAIGLPLLVPMLVGIVVAWRRRERLLTIYGVVYLVAICLADPGRRYLLPVLPVLIFWFVLGGSTLLRAASDRLRVFPPARAALVGTILIAMLLAGNLLRIGKVVYEARSPNFYEVTEGRHMADLFHLAAWLRENARPGDLVLAREDRFLHYFGRVRTRRTISDSLAKRGLRYWRVARRLPITFVVRDPEDPTLKVMDEFLRQQSAALAPVERFGGLRLLRLDRDRLSDERD